MTRTNVPKILWAIFKSAGIPTEVGAGEACQPLSFREEDMKAAKEGLAEVMDYIQSGGWVRKIQHHRGRVFYMHVDVDVSHFILELLAAKVATYFSYLGFTFKMMTYCKNETVHNVWAQTISQLIH